MGTVEDEIAELQLAGKATANALSTGTKIILETCWQSYGQRSQHRHQDYLGHQGIKSLNWQ
jgi:hypothetical protein